MLKRLIIIHVALAAGLCVAPAYGQGRGELNVGAQFYAPGSDPGFGLSTFRDYSYGLGLVNRSGGGGGGVLDSSLNIRSPMAGRAWAPVSDMTQLPPLGSSSSGMARSRVLYRAFTVSLEDLGGLGPSSLLERSDTASLSMANAFGVAPVDMRQATEPLTSLAPSRPGLYGRYMTEGEGAFREMRYEAAVQKFEVANDIAHHSPESLLSLMHAYYALEQYNTAAFYLRQAMVYFPELPMANLSLRGFFATPAEFVRAREALRLQTTKTPTDADVWFLYGYVQWFDANPDEANQALQQALKNATDPMQAKAIATFREGCAASGRGGAVAEPASQPAGGDSGATEAHK